MILWEELQYEMEGGAMDIKRTTYNPETMLHMPYFTDDSKGEYIYDPKHTIEAYIEFLQTENTKLQEERDWFEKEFDEGTDYYEDLLEETEQELTGLKQAAQKVVEQLREESKQIGDWAVVWLGAEEPPTNKLDEIANDLANVLKEVDIE